MENTDDAAEPSPAEVPTRPAKAAPGVPARPGAANAASGAPKLPSAASAEGGPPGKVRGYRKAGGNRAERSSDEKPASPRPSATLAVVAFFFAVLGLIPFFFLVPTLVAAMLAIMVLTKRKAGRGIAIVSLWLAGASLIVVPLVLLMLYPFKDSEAAGRGNCELHLKAINEALKNYQSKHGGAFPPNLSALVSERLLTADAAACPSATGSPESSYCYVAPTGLPPSDTILVCDRSVWHRGLRIVLLLDGTVHPLSEDSFQEVLRTPQHRPLALALNGKAPAASPPQAIAAPAPGRPAPVSAAQPFAPAWKPGASEPSHLLSTMRGHFKKGSDGALTLTDHTQLSSQGSFGAPAALRIVAQMHGGEACVSLGYQQIVFVTNRGGKSSGPNRIAAGQWPADHWVALELQLQAKELIVSVDGNVRARITGDYIKNKAPLRIWSPKGGPLKVRSVDMVRL